MMIGQDNHAQTEPNLLRPLTEGAVQDLWAGRAGEVQEEVVLDRPDHVEARSSARLICSSASCTALAW
jgi:hypothetical protein